MALRVYLAGPLDSQAADRDLKWRHQAACALANMGIHPVNPARDIESIHVEETTLTPAEIVQRDMRDVLSCDLVIANFTCDTYPAIGTSMEIKAAFDAGIPVLVVWPHERMCPVFLQYHAAAVYRSLAVAIDAVNRRWRLA